MRMYEILAEEKPETTLAGNLQKQADAASQKAKKLKTQAKVQRKRDQSAKARSTLLKANSEISKLLSNPTQ